MKHPTIPAVPIAVAHLSNPTHNDNPNYPFPTFVVAHNSPRCTRLVFSLWFRIPLVVAQKSPCCGELGQKQKRPSISRHEARRKRLRRVPRRILAAGQRPARHLAASRGQSLGQDTQDTQDSQDCACLVRKLASLSLARKPFPGHWRASLPCHRHGCLGCPGCLGRPPEHEISSGRPAHPQWHSPWNPTTDWERRHLGGAWECTSQWLEMPPPGRRLSQSELRAGR